MLQSPTTLKEAKEFIKQFTLFGKPLNSIGKINEFKYDHDIPEFLIEICVLKQNYFAFVIDQHDKNNLEVTIDLDTPLGPFSEFPNSLSTKKIQKSINKIEKDLKKIIKNNSIIALALGIKT